MSRETRRSWFGYLAHDNIDHVAERIRIMLADRPYTWVATNTTQPHVFPEVRTSQRLEPDKATHKEAIHLWESAYHVGEEQRVLKGITAVDTYGVWGISTHYPTEREARKASNNVYVDIEGNGEGQRDCIKISQKNGYGETLHWVISPEHGHEEMW